MESRSFGTWLRQTLGGASHRGSHASGPRVGMHVTTLDGTVLGTVSTLWPGSDATDHAKHEDTLGVLPDAKEGKAMLFVPSTAIGRVGDENVSLTVDRAQVTARGWQYRPKWLPTDPAETSESADKS